MADIPIIPCKSPDGWKEVVDAYAKDLATAAPKIGRHGLSPIEFEESGLFKSAIERIRGQTAASLKTKQRFIDSVLSHLKDAGLITKWEFVGSRERHDYEIFLKGGRVCCIEAKGCLDGNNTNIFKRPQNADEFLIWSLCQNPGANPRHNAWSGIHTRLSAEIIARKERVDGVIIWDMLCGTIARPCPKLEANKARATVIDGKPLPPPCFYLFPRTIPDPRNNPSPKCWNLEEVKFLSVLGNAFKVKDEEVVKVSIEARMYDADVQRRTVYVTGGGKKLHESNWTAIRRAS